MTPEIIKRERFRLVAGSEGEFPEIGSMVYDEDVWGDKFECIVEKIDTDVGAIHVWEHKLDPSLVPLKPKRWLRYWHVKEEVPYTLDEIRKEINQRINRKQRAIEDHQELMGRLDAEFVAFSQLWKETYAKGEGK